MNSAMQPIVSNVFRAAMRLKVVQNPIVKFFPEAQPVYLQLKSTASADMFRPLGMTPNGGQSLIKLRIIKWSHSLRYRIPAYMTQSKGTIRHRLLLAIDDFRQADKAFVNQALSLAEEVHEGHLRKPSKNDPYVKCPFITHPMRVALILLEELGFRDRDYVASALLHDVVERSNGKVTTHDLENSFGRSLALSISIMTRPVPDQDIPRSKQLQTYHDRIAQASLPTRVVKLAERLDNMREGAELDDDEWKKRYLKETVDVYIPIAENTDDYLYNALMEQCQEWEEALAKAHS